MGVSLNVALRVGAGVTVNVWVGKDRENVGYDADRVGYECVNVGNVGVCVAVRAGVMVTL